jgi:hypothetical protein
MVTKFVIEFGDKFVNKFMLILTEADIAPVRDRVRNQVICRFYRQIDNQVHDQVWDQIWHQVGDQVHNHVWIQVHNHVWIQVHDQVDN